MTEHRSSPDDAWAVIETAVEALERSKQHSDRAREVREAATVDRMRRHALGVLASIPVVGSAISAAIDAHIPAARERRLDDFLAKLAEAVDALEVAGQDPEPPDDFADIVEAVLEDVVRTAEEEKRRAYAAVLVNALLTTGDDEERLALLDLLRRVRTIHIRILGVLSDPRTTFSDHLLATLRRSLPDYSAEMIRLAWLDLSSWGLVRVGTDRLQDSLLLTPRQETSLGTGMEPSSSHLSLRTAIAKQFVAFITAPTRRD
jgi:hypothetical protein